MKIQPMTRSLLAILKEAGIIRIVRDRDRKSIPHLDKVYDDLRRLAKSKEIKFYESTSEPYEIILTSLSQTFKDSFIV